MNEKRSGANKVKQDVRVKVAIWASQNVEVIAKKNLRELQALIADSLGVGDVPTSTIQDILKAAGIEYNKKASPQKGGRNIHAKLRSLARILRNHMTEIGSKNPANLDALCTGHTIDE